MRVLHVLDHSIPLHSGYAFRMLAILAEQRRLGWETLHPTGLNQGDSPGDDETVDGWQFHRTRSTGTLMERLPVVNQLEVFRSPTRRIEEVDVPHRPDIVHAHSPSLNGITALRAARRLDVPVVYEMRASWEDAAVDHGTVHSTRRQRCRRPSRAD